MVALDKFLQLVVLIVVEDFFLEIGVFGIARTNPLATHVGVREEQHGKIRTGGNAHEKIEKREVLFRGIPEIGGS